MRRLNKYQTISTTFLHRFIIARRFEPNNSEPIINNKTKKKVIQNMFRLPFMLSTKASTEYYYNWF